MSINLRLLIRILFRLALAVVLLLWDIRAFLLHHPGTVSGIEGISGPEHDVGILAGDKAAHAMVHLQHAGAIQAEAAQGHVLWKAHAHRA